MRFDPNIIASYDAQDVQPGTWDDTDPDSSGGYLADEGDGVAMGMAFVQFRAGTEFDFSWPYDEVSIVTAGSLSVRSGGRLLTARQGEILTQPRGVPGRFEITEDMEMICLHHPTFARAFGITVHEHQALAESGQDAPDPMVGPRGPGSAGPFVDPTMMQVLSPSDILGRADAQAEHGGQVVHIADGSEGFPFGMTVSGFRRAETHEVVPPHDQAIMLTAGRVTVRSQGRVLIVRPGRLLYLPEGIPALLEIEEGTVAIGVHHPATHGVVGTRTPVASPD